MTGRRCRYGTVCATLALAVALLLCLTLPAAAGFVVIAHKDVPVASLEKGELQAMFLGEKVKWDRIHYIKVALPEDQALLKEFLHTIVGKTPSQFDNHWLRLVYTGKAMYPTAFETDKLVEYVAKQKGAVSFVPSGSSVSTVKILSIK